MAHRFCRHYLVLQSGLQVYTFNDFHIKDSAFLARLGGPIGSAFDFFSTSSFLYVFRHSYTLFEFFIATETVFSYSFRKFGKLIFFVQNFHLKELFAFKPFWKLSDSKKTCESFFFKKTNYKCLKKEFFFPVLSISSFCYSSLSRTWNRPTLWLKRFGQIICCLIPIQKRCQKCNRKNFHVIKINFCHNNRLQYIHQSLSQWFLTCCSISKKIIAEFASQVEIIIRRKHRKR